MNPRRERKITQFCLAVTASLYAAFLIEFFWRLSLPSFPASLAESAFFLTLVMCLLWGSVLYQIARYGYFVRAAAHKPPSRRELEQFYDGHTPPAVTILIPSFKEEIYVLRQTILSAALLDYPRRRIAVLIDNQPHVRGSDLKELRHTRQMIDDLNITFRSHARPLQKEWARFLGLGDKVEERAETLRLQTLYEEVADHFDGLAVQTGAASGAFAHHDSLFADQVLKVLAEEHRARAVALRESPQNKAAIAHEYRRLAALFDVEIASFERKRYANLSHERNKAMNLNSYIALIGKSFREENRADGCWLIQCSPEESDIAIPDCDYVLTLDADSVLLPDYALRLIGAMEADPRIAVAQTPYSAFPGAPGVLERIAGATTDLQYIVHQGFTNCDATYWVGANAVIRLAALKDIEQKVQERGHPIAVFIQDRTVIEDTDSTIDLIRRGWRLLNYPQRLAYSATPSDYGSLAIQRRRWANGGLVILPDLLGYLRQQQLFTKVNALQTFMRTHYLCSPAAGSLGLLAILLYPFDDELTSIWLIATAIPYYFLYGRDLRHCGYRTSDLLRVYAMILLLLPVNLSGVFRSALQIVTGKKSPFSRTPKIDGRTASPPRHLLFHGGMIVYLIMQTGFALEEARYGHAAFALVNAAALIYALTYFIGWGNAWTDVKHSLRLGRNPSRTRQYLRRPSVTLSDGVDGTLGTPLPDRP